MSDSTNFTCRNDSKDLQIYILKVYLVNISQKKAEEKTYSCINII